METTSQTNLSPEGVAVNSQGAPAPGKQAEKGQEPQRGDGAVVSRSIPNVALIPLHVVPRQQLAEFVLIRQFAVMGLLVGQIRFHGVDA